MSLKAELSTPYVVFLDYLLDDGPKPCIFEENIALLSKVRVKMCKNIEQVKGRNFLFKTGEERD